MVKPMRRSVGQHVRYRFDSTISRGTLPVIGYLALLTFALVFSAALLLAITGTAINEDEQPGIGEAFWQSLLRILDPGTFSGDNGWFLRIVMLIVTLIGISIAAVLIGLIASGIEQRIEQLRRGRSKVVESGHTLILGWSPRIHTIVSELCVANENQRRPAIVILSREEKEAMEDELAARIADTKTTRIVCRTGDPASLNDLAMASAAEARSIIILGSGDAASDPDADAAVVKSVLAVLHIVAGADIPIIAEVEDAETSWALREASNDRLLTVRSSDVIARITAQACRQSGLSAVCQELLDFDGDEIYFQHVPELTGHTFGDALLAFEESSVIGLRHGDGTIAVNPPMDAVIGAEDAVIAVSEDDDTIVFAGVRDEAVPAAALAPRAAGVSEQLLVVGWNPLGPAVLRELDQFAAPGSSVDVIVDPDVIAADELGDLGLERLALRYEAERGDLDELTQTVSGREFDHVIILGYRDGMSIAEADARTLLTLLLLRRALGGTDFGTGGGRRNRVVTELLDSSDVELAQATGADDFVVSDALSSYVIAQLSENPELDDVFTDLFDAEGSALGLRSADRYVDTGDTVTFARVVAAARARGEIAIGYRFAARNGSEAEVVVNPAKSARLRFEPDDRIVVIGPPE
jgi:voltage-gated potassium channel Kch